MGEDVKRGFELFECFDSVNRVYVCNGDIVIFRIIYDTTFICGIIIWELSYSLLGIMVRY